MIYLEAVMSVNMIITLVEVVLLVVLLVVFLGHLILLYVELYKTENDKLKRIVKDESGHIISIDGIPFDEYMERL